MAEQGSLITEEMRRAIGASGPPRTVEIERGAITAFARAIGDPNPLFNDKIQARSSRYGGVIAPPTFLRAVSGEGRDLLVESGLDNVLDGGSDWTYLEPVRPGDRISVVTTILDLTEREGRLGKMLFITSEAAYTNQLDQQVATQRSTLIRY